MDAKKGVFRDGRWVLNNSMVQIFDRSTGGYDVKFHEKSVEVLDFTPDDLRRVMRKSEEMSFKELLSYVKKVEAEGYDATAYRVDLHAKIAFPFVCIVLCLVGTGLSFRGRIREGLPVAFPPVGVPRRPYEYITPCLAAKLSRAGQSEQPPAVLRGHAQRLKPVP